MYIRTPNVFPQFTLAERIFGGFALLLLVLAGLTFGTLFLGMGAVAGLVMVVRVWWLRRRLRSTPGRGPIVLEGEYQVLERRFTPEGHARV